MNANYKKFLAAQKCPIEGFRFAMVKYHEAATKGDEKGAKYWVEVANKEQKRAGL